MQLEPESESNFSSPSNTPDLGVADPAPTRVHVKRPFPRVQGGFDNFTSLLDDFQPGALGLILGLWGNNWKGTEKIMWIIGTMMVSYSDNDDWVTIKQKAEDRAVKTFMERFIPQQKLNAIKMMEAWKNRPDQGILKKIRRKRSHCFTLARFIDLTNQGFSVYSEKTVLHTIKVGAEVDTGVENLFVPSGRYWRWFTTARRDKSPSLSSLSPSSSCLT